MQGSLQYREGGTATERHISSFNPFRSNHQLTG
jgi:hypothetical protein